MHRTSRSTRWIVSGALALTGTAGLVAARAASIDTPAPVASTRSDLAAADQCVGGPEPRLAATLTPLRVSGKAGAEVLELRLDLASHFASAGSARWAVEIVDDLGRPVQAAVLSAPVSLGLGARRDALVTTPVGLTDGFYAVRVTAAGKASAETAAAVLERYLEVRSGAVTPIDSDDYHQRSRALMEVTP